MKSNNVSACLCLITLQRITCLRTTACLVHTHEFGHSIHVAVIFGPRLKFFFLPFSVGFQLCPELFIVNVSVDATFKWKYIVNLLRCIHKHESILQPGTRAKSCRTFVVCESTTKKGNICQASKPCLKSCSTHRCILLTTSPRFLFSCSLLVYNEPTGPISDVIRLNHCCAASRP